MEPIFNMKDISGKDHFSKVIIIIIGVVQVIIAIIFIKSNLVEIALVL